MFGLMKTRICSQKPSEREARRLAFCGTCKTLGARYGQRTRLLLNHDAVFLAELMEALAPAAAPDGDRAFRSFSCLALPAYGPKVPIRLRYAAAATVFLAEAKLADRLDDSPSLLADAFSRAYGRAFQRAAADLSAWDAPVDPVLSLLGSQGAREEAASALLGDRSSVEVLARLAGPTAESTALVFEHGARLAGRPGAARAMGELGRAFGTLVYLLDAYEDFERDSTRGEFNAFRAAYALARGPMPEELRPAFRQAVWSSGVEAVQRIEELPFPEVRRSLFAGRLRSNLSARLGESVRSTHVCEGSPGSGERAPLRSALGRARAIADASLSPLRPAARAIAVPLFVLLAFPLALFLPSWARPERSLRESLGLALNLMFAGGVVRALTTPLLFSAAPGGPGGVGEAVKAARHAKKGSGGDGCCDGCDCGDCCCDCGGCDC